MSVTLNGNTQASLDFRQGYYAGKQFGKFNTQEKERQLEEALMLQDPVTELTLALEINYFQLNRAEYFVPMALKVPGSELALARKGGAERTLIDFIGEINLLDGGGRVRALRPEKIRLMPVTGARLAGKIETANFLGGSTLYKVRSDDVRTLLARETHVEARSPLQPGDAVGLHWNDGDAVSVHRHQGLLSGQQHQNVCPRPVLGCSEGALDDTGSDWVRSWKMESL